MAAKPAPLVAAIGARKTGKTAWIKQQVKRMRPPRLIVWDPIGEYGELGTVFSDGAKLIDFVGARRTYAAVYQPGDQLSTYKVKFDWFCKLAWALTNVAMVVDELADVTSPGWAPDSWSAITRKGANHGIATFAASQRPAEVDKTFLGNCTFIHCSRCNDESSVTTMAKHLGVPPDDIRRLQSDREAGIFEFIERNLDTGAVRTGRLSFK